MTVHLRIAGVSKQYGALRVLHGCSVDVAKGSVLTLLGPSGCGKTTLLRTIAGFVTPDAGRVEVGGQNISQLPPNRRRVGYVFQNYALFPHLTVAGNVAYGLRVRRTGRAETAERVGRALDLVALAGLSGRYPAQLSGGQQQRVAIARALVLEPDVLLLDEPFNALDASLRITMQAELRKLIARVGITSIFVTHDQSEAMALSDTVAVMRAGRVEQVGAPLDVYDRPASPYVADFMGRANLLPVRVAAGRVLGVEGVAAALPDGDATLAVRPENLRFEGGAGPGWPGEVAFATALGGQVEYEVGCGFAQPVRVLVDRQAHGGVLPAGTAVRVAVRHPPGCVVFGAPAFG